MSTKVTELLMRCGLETRGAVNVDLEAIQSFLGVVSCESDSLPRRIARCNSECERFFRELKPLFDEWKMSSSGNITADLKAVADLGMPVKEDIFETIAAAKCSWFGTDNDVQGAEALQGNSNRGAPDQLVERGGTENGLGSANFRSDSDVGLEQIRSSSHPAPHAAAEMTHLPRSVRGDDVD